MWTLSSGRDPGNSVVHRPGAVCDICDAAERAGHGDTVQSRCDDLNRVAREQHGNAECGQRPLTDRGNGRRLAARVVPDEQQRASFGLTPNMFA